MVNIHKYNHFLLEKEFESIINDLFKVIESNGRWTGSNTYEWDLTKNKSKLQKFLSKLSKEEIKSYFVKLLNKLKDLPYKIRRFLLNTYVKIFLTYVSCNCLLSAINPLPNQFVIDDSIKKEITEIIEKIEKTTKHISELSKIKKSNFEEAQKLVKISEKGYSNDKKDRGNYIKTKQGKKFIGTNHGIAALTLKEYLGRTPTQEDMKNLTYQEAIKIFKKKYWINQNLSEFHNQSVANLIYDGCVNQGNAKMQKVMRKILRKNGINIDKISNPFDKKWIEEANDLDQKKLFQDIKTERENKYREAKTFKRHGTGWLARLNSLKYEEIKDKV